MYVCMYVCMFLSMHGMYDASYLPTLLMLMRVGREEKEPTKAREFSCATAMIVRFLMEIKLF